MDVHRLRILRELAVRGTVQSTAQAMSLTPSAISQQLKLLQREAGTPLLEPHGRRIRLTEGGRVLVGHAELVIAALDRARAEMDAYSDTPNRTVRVAMFPSVATTLLPGLISRAAQGGVRVSVEDIETPADHGRIQLDDFDIFVVHRDERENPDWRPRAEVLPLLREPLDILLPPGHPLAAHKRVPLVDLASDPWIGVALGTMSDDIMRSLAATSGYHPRIVQRINDLHIVEKLVEAGIGVALIPRYAALSGRSVRRPLSGVKIARQIDILTRAGASKRPAIAAVLDILAALAKDLDGTAPHQDVPVSPTAM